MYWLPWNRFMFWNAIFGLFCLYLFSFLILYLWGRRGLWVCPGISFCSLSQPRSENRQSWCLYSSKIGLQSLFGLHLSDVLCCNSCFAGINSTHAGSSPVESLYSFICVCLWSGIRVQAICIFLVRISFQTLSSGLPLRCHIPFLLLNLSFCLFLIILYPLFSVQNFPHF